MIPLLTSLSCKSSDLSVAVRDVKHVHQLESWPLAPEKMCETNDLNQSIDPHSQTVMSWPANGGYSLLFLAATSVENGP